MNTTKAVDIFLSIFINDYVSIISHQTEKFIHFTFVFNIYFFLEKITHNHYLSALADDVLDDLYDSLCSLILVKIICCDNYVRYWLLMSS